MSLRRLFSGLNMSNGRSRQLPIRGLEEFFPVQEAMGEGHKFDKDRKLPLAAGTKKVVVGGEWRAWMLREKSTEDLHKLWYVLLKERNALLTERQVCRSKNINMPNPERRKKVQKSMARIKLILHERSEIYQHNKQKRMENEGNKEKDDTIETN